MVLVFQNRLDQLSKFTNIAAEKRLKLAFDLNEKMEKEQREMEMLSQTMSNEIERFPTYHY